MPDAHAMGLDARRGSRSLSTSQPLTLPVSVPARAHTCPTIPPALWIHVGVGGVVGVALRAVCFFRTRVHCAFPGGIAAWRDDLKVCRIAAASMLTVVPPRAFLRVVANMVDNHSLGDWAMGHLIGDGVRLVCPAADIESPIPLGQGPVPRPTNIGRASVDKGCIAFHRLASNRTASTGKGCAMSTHPQVMGVAQPELLDVQRSTTSVDGAYLLRHV